MPRYSITESVGNKVQPVHSFEDLEKHHPSSGRQPGRDYATINGKLEEVRHAGGHTFIKKDFILGDDAPGPVLVPAPDAGYVHYLHDHTNAVRIYDKPFGTPGAVMRAQVLHMKRDTSPAEGATISYGQPMGQMGDTGSPGSVHVHVEAEVGQFQRYIRDIDSGAIAPGLLPARGIDDSRTNRASGKTLLSMGCKDADVHSLQRQLTQLSYAGADGYPLASDSDFGPNTRHAVEAFQHDHHLTVDGKVGPCTREVLDETLRARDPPTLENPAHSGNALYREAQQAVYALDRHMGRTPDRQSDQLAGAATVAAQKAGLEHISDITLSKDGSRAFAVQAGALPKLAHVQTAEAVNTSLMQSSQAWNQQAAAEPTQPVSAQASARSAPPISL